MAAPRPSLGLSWSLIRQRRRIAFMESRCKLAAWASLAFLAGWRVPATAQISPNGYTLVDLGPVGGYRYSYANGGNSNGGYVAVVCSNSSPFQAARYTPGVG